MRSTPQDWVSLIIAMEVPLVSCIMPTYNRRSFVPLAIKYFLRQDYCNKELIVLDDGNDKIDDLVPDVTEIKYVALPAKLTIGEKRNLAIEYSRGDIIVHWDDDDWMDSRRISYQVEDMLREDADVSGINRVLFYDLRSGKHWLYVYPGDRQTWLYGGALCYRKSYWAKKKFPPLDIGEDTKFIWSPPSGKMVALSNIEFYVGIIHSRNTCAKNLSGAWWQRWQGETIQNLVNNDWDFYAHMQSNLAQNICV